MKNEKTNLHAYDKHATNLRIGTPCGLVEGCGGQSINLVLLTYLTWENLFRRIPRIHDASKVNV
jgi:hypothetical protein